jgi:hypothetical protein
MAAKNKLLTVLSEAEQYALYGLPDFDYEAPHVFDISPTAWRHILLNGHYTFQSDGKLIDLNALVEGLELG